MGSSGPALAEDFLNISCGDAYDAASDSLSDDRSQSRAAIGYGHSLVDVWKTVAEVFHLKHTNGLLKIRDDFAMGCKDRPDESGAELLALVMNGAYR